MWNDCHTDMQQTLLQSKPLTHMHMLVPKKCANMYILQNEKWMQSVI